MRGNIDNLSRKLSKKQQELLWRSNKVMDLSSKGMTQDQIAIELQVSQGNVSDDISCLKKNHKNIWRNILLKIFSMNTANVWLE